MLVDSVSYTASVLRDDLARRGFNDVQTVSSTLDLPAIRAVAMPTDLASADSSWISSNSSKMSSDPG